MGVDVDLSGWSLRSGVDYTFAEGTILAGGGRLVDAADPAALQAATGFASAIRPFTGTLSNSREQTGLGGKSRRGQGSVSHRTQSDLAAGSARSRGRPATGR